LQLIKDEKVRKNRLIIIVSNTTLLYIKKACVKEYIITFSLISLNSAENKATLLAETYSLNLRTGHI
jgi:hypothetical protein